MEEEKDRMLISLCTIQCDPREHSVLPQLFMYFLLTPTSHIITQMFPKGEGGMYIQKSADTFRAELEKDAFVRHLKERAAIAESGAGVREKELQLVRLIAFYSLFATRFNL